jgi:hypothetical protein
LRGMLLVCALLACRGECEFGRERRCDCAAVPVGTQLCGSDDSWGRCICAETCPTRGARRACSSCLVGNCAQYCEPIEGAGSPLVWGACAEDASALRDAGPDVRTSALDYMGCASGADCASSSACFRNANFRFVCGTRCASDSECPRAPAGYAYLRPHCDTSQVAPVCVLFCDPGQSCPHGLTCERFAADGRYDYCG